MRINMFFPQLAPYPGAGSMRARSMIDGLVSECRKRGAVIELNVFTATKDPLPIDGVLLHPLAWKSPENTSSFAARFVGESIVGFLAVFRLLAATRRKDIILTSSPPFIPSLIVGIAAFLFRKRYILDVRDLYPLVYAEANIISKTSWIYRLLEKLEKKWIGGATSILAATQGLSRHIQSINSTSPVSTVYNGFPARLMSIEGKRRQGFTVCFHGILGQFQDVESVLEVAKRLGEHDIDVVVIGYGVKSALLQEATIPNLHYLGRLTFDETIDVVAGCHLGLCLRRNDEISRDAFPVKVWECLGLGIPSVVTPICEAGEFLQKNGCGIQFEAGEIDSIADWIIGIRDDARRYADMAAACRNVRQKFTREQSGAEAAGIILGALMPD